MTERYNEEGEREELTKHRPQLVAAFTTEEKVANTGDKSPGVPRLGLPPYEWWSEALHGVARSPGVHFATGGGEFGYATSFPQPINLGATWDLDLVKGIAGKCLLSMVISFLKHFLLVWHLLTFGRVIT